MASGWAESAMLTSAPQQHSQQASVSNGHRGMNNSRYPIRYDDIPSPPTPELHKARRLLQKQGLRYCAIVENPSKTAQLTIHSRGVGARDPSEGRGQQTVHVAQTGERRRHVQRCGLVWLCERAEPGRIDSEQRQTQTGAVVARD
jgi:hypothetical protein